MAWVTAEEDVIGTRQLVASAATHREHGTAEKWIHAFNTDNEFTAHNCRIDRPRAINQDDGTTLVRVVVAERFCLLLLNICDIDQ